MDPSWMLAEQIPDDRRPASPVAHDKQQLYSLMCHSVRDAQSIDDGKGLHRNSTLDPAGGLPWRAMSKIRLDHELNSISRDVLETTPESI